MRNFPTTVARSLLIPLLIIGTVALQGCAAMAQDQQAYDTQKCQQFGLAPGSDAYIQCINMGANAYAASRNQAASTNTAPAVMPGMAILPIAIPVAPSPPAGNNSCSAPKSTPRGGCPGCSISCGGQQASCTPGQEFPGGSDLCMTNASCQCQ